MMGIENISKKESRGIYTRVDMQLLKKLYIISEEDESDFAIQEVQMVSPKVCGAKADQCFADSFKVTLLDKINNKKESHKIFNRIETYRANVLKDVIVDFSCGLTITMVNTTYEVMFEHDLMKSTIIGSNRLMGHMDKRYLLFDSNVEFPVMIWIDDTLISIDEKCKYKESKLKFDNEILRSLAVNNVSLTDALRNSNGCTDTFLLEEVQLTKPQLGILRKFRDEGLFFPVMLLPNKAYYLNKGGKSGYLAIDNPELIRAKRGM